MPSFYALKCGLLIQSLLAPTPMLVSFVCAGVTTIRELSMHDLGINLDVVCMEGFGNIRQIDSCFAQHLVQALFS